MSRSAVRLRCTWFGRAVLPAYAIISLTASALANAQCSPQEQAKFTASDAAAGDNFGIRVDLSGDTAIVGAYADDHAGGIDAGSAYVFVRSGGIWTEQAKLIASDAAAGDFFGLAVAVAGDTAVIGARQDDHAAGTDAGSAYVFVRTGGIWTQQAKLIASDATANDNFGWSVALSGDTIVVGSFQDDNAGGTDAGSAYVFVRAGSLWSEQAKLTATDAAATDKFGYSVVVSGDTAIISAYLDDDGGPSSGSAYVFVRSGGIWSQQAKLTASDAASGDLFGTSVALSGETAVIGAGRDTHSGLVNAGSAYVFVRSGVAWTQQAKLTATDAASLDFFGDSVALSNDTALVGADGDDRVGGTNDGSAYLFTRSGTSWTPQAKLTASDAAINDTYGISVAMSAGTAIIGAHRDDHAGGADAGSAYAYVLGCAVVCCSGDFSEDNVVTDADIHDFVSALLASGACPTPPECCPGDFNSDQVVDGADITGFVMRLFSGGACP